MITVDINDPVLAALATAVTESGTGYNSGAAVELNLDLHEHYVKCFIEWNQFAKSLAVGIRSPVGNSVVYWDVKEGDATLATSRWNGKKVTKALANRMASAIVSAICIRLLQSNPDDLRIDML